MINVFDYIWRSTSMGTVRLLESIWLENCTNSHILTCDTPPRDQSSNYGESVDVLDRILRKKMVRILKLDFTMCKLKDRYQLLTENIRIGVQYEQRTMSRFDSTSTQRTIFSFFRHHGTLQFGYADEWSIDDYKKQTQTKRMNIFSTLALIKFAA